MFVAHLKIDAANELQIVAVAPAAVGQFTARVLHLRKFRSKLQSCRAELGRIDAVVDERRAQRDGSSGIAARRSERSQIARQHCSRGQERSRVSGILARRCSLVSGKEEQLVGLNGPADGSAELK